MCAVWTLNLSLVILFLQLLLFLLPFCPLIGSPGGSRFEPVLITS